MANRLLPSWRDKVSFEVLPLDQLKPHPRNSRKHGDAQVKVLRKLVRTFGPMRPILIDEHDTILAGHGVQLAALAEGMTEFPTFRRTGLSDQEKRAYIIADNKTAMLSEWDEGVLRVELGELKGLGFDVELTGFGDLELVQFLAGNKDAGGKLGGLSERFLAPPFSVLDARSGWWQDRKRAWLALGIKSELGRGANLLEYSDTILAAQRGEKPFAKSKVHPIPGGGLGARSVWMNKGKALRDGTMPARKSKKPDAPA